MTSPILRQPNWVKPSTSEASKHALFTLESTIEHIVLVMEKTCNKKVKTCPPSRYQPYQPGTIWSYQADMPGNATVAM